MNTCSLVVRSILLTFLSAATTYAQASITTSLTLSTSATASASQSHTSSASLKSSSSTSIHSTSSTVTSGNGNGTSSSSVPASNNPTDNSGTDTTNTSTGLVNYFFAFIAIALCIAGLVLWMFIRRRKRASRARLHDRSDALARDLTGTGAWPVDQERWRDRRRWMHGHLRPREGAEQEDRVEGLNEHGEAPPPYKAPVTSSVSSDGMDEHASEPRRPDNVVIRDDIGTKPPDYEPAVTSTSRDGGLSPDVLHDTDEGRRSTGLDRRARDTSRRRNIGPPS